MQNIKEIVSNVNGGTFVGLDTEVNVKLTGGKKNPMQGRVTKITKGSSVMIFQNKNVNGYAAMVMRRLLQEGKDPSTFQLGPRKWGERLPDLPIIKHLKEGSSTPEYYLEVIFLHAGTSFYFLDGKPINKSKIIGLPEAREPSGQGGLDNQVIIRCYNLNSIRAMRVDRQYFIGPFIYED